MLHLPWLDNTNLDFPPVDTALKEPNGLLAAGGDLSTKRLLKAYSEGIFPWFSENDPILWWSPDPRLILFPEKLKISRSLDKTIRNHVYLITENKAFHAVIAQCAKPRKKQAETWITQEMQMAYQDFHLQGYAKSVEVWEDEELVGGLYGVSVGRAFFGESMFSLKRDTSKLALVHIAQSQDYDLIDCQIPSEHLVKLGAELIPREIFIKLLKQAIT